MGVESPYRSRTRTLDRFMAPKKIFQINDLHEKLVQKNTVVEIKNTANRFLINRFNFKIILVAFSVEVYSLNTNLFPKNRN